jgi:long-chain fatty acid transport protein
VKRKLSAVLSAVAPVVALVAFAGDAGASGLYFTDRGVRPLGRGGAFVAGADDLGATWYNPAGLADAGTSVLVDASWLHFTSDYTPQTQVVAADGTVSVVTSPTVHGTTPVLPIPTIAGSYNFGKRKQYTVALGFGAPYAALASYPADAQSRYSLVSLKGSTLILGGAWFAYKPVEWFRVGVGFETLMGTFSSSVVFNANPQNRLVSAAEDPQYDALSQLNAGPIFAPSGNAGITVVPEKHVRIGLSGQLGFLVDAPATIAVQLPTAPLFDNASQQGDRARVHFDLPPEVRLGVEVRPVPALRVEVAYVREFWSVHQDIQIVPEGVSINNVTGFPAQFAVSPITIPRDFKDSNSYRLGGEYSFTLARYMFDVRAGASYDQSAIPAAYLAPLTVDVNKVVTALGASIHIGAHWRFDAMYGHVFGFTTTVSPAEAAVPLINPVRGNPTQTTAINGGTYSARADVLGVGLNYKF